MQSPKRRQYKHASPAAAPDRGLLRGLLWRMAQHFARCGVQVRPVGAGRVQGSGTGAPDPTVGLKIGRPTPQAAEAAQSMMSN
jgi:hypothetical protein